MIYIVEKNGKLIKQTKFTRDGFFEHVLKTINIDWPGKLTECKTISSSFDTLSVIETSKKISVRYSRIDQDHMYMNGSIWKATLLTE